MTTFCIQKPKGRNEVITNMSCLKIQIQRDSRCCYFYAFLKTVSVLRALNSLKQMLSIDTEFAEVITEKIELLSLSFKGNAWPSYSVF